MDIVVQGEHYESREELLGTIEALEEKLAEMPSDTPEHNDLSRHIERLREAASGEAESETESPTVEPAEPASPLAPEEEEEEEYETTHDLQDAAENGKILLCPTCGQEVPFPEVPPMDNTVERCSNCDGWGKVVRPTRVDGHVWRDCPVCQGEGVVQKLAAPPPAPARKAVEVPEAPGALFNPTTEQWDPPAGVQPPWAGATWDPFYGRWS